MAEFHNEFHAEMRGTINQAGRDINVTTVSSLDALAALGRLRGGLVGAGLAPAERAAAERELDAVERELMRDDPDKAAIADRLGSATEMLKSAGALAAAGAALVGPIGVIAGFLGPIGHAVVRLTES